MEINLIDGYDDQNVVFHGTNTIPQYSLHYNDTGYSMILSIIIVSKFVSESDTINCAVITLTLHLPLLYNNV